VPLYDFSVIALPEGKQVRKMTGYGSDEGDAVKQLLRVARAQDAKAIIGITGRVLYPHGLLGGETWVLMKEAK